VDPAQGPGPRIPCRCSLWIAFRAAPAFIRLGHEYEQDIYLEYGNDRVIRRVLQCEAPTLALSVSIGWREERGAPKSYSYEDTLSTPKLKVTNKRLIRYRLLEFGDMVVFDEITGLYGRPTSGVLGLLFQLIGEGKSTADIARSLRLSPHTVDTYRERMKSKLNLKNATELQRVAIQWVMERG